MKRWTWALAVLAMNCGPAQEISTTLGTTIRLPGSDAGSMNVPTDGGTAQGVGTPDASVLDAGRRDAGAPLPPRRRSGRVTLGRGPFGDTEFDAVFIEEMLNAPECMTTAVDGCTVTDCRPVGNSLPVRFESAGAITVQVGDVGQTVVPHPTTSFYQATVRTPLTSGAVASVSAPGQTVPGFSVSETVPEFADVLLDGCGRFNCDNAPSKDAGLTLRWDGGTDLVFVSVAEAVLSGRFVTCQFPASAGIGRVTPAALSAVPAGPVIIGFGTRKLRTLDIGPFPTTVFLQDWRQLSPSLVP
jgi:hypothetical protein